MSFTVPGYTVYERLGTGARSSIWLVADQRTGKHYALKRVVRRATDDNRYIVQGETDFEVSSKFDHPNMRRSFEIRRIRKLFQIRELQIIMEYVEGRTIEQLGHLDLPQLIDIFLPVARGLEYLHGLGYLHTDLKPNNILVDTTGTVKVIDFGQSCPIGHIKGRIQGTPDYIAPEQVERGMPLDQRTDVFNFGATLYWSLVGKPYPTVLPGKKRATGIDLLGPREAPPPHEVNPAVPLALSRLVMDCCQTHPKDRPASMNEVIRRLEVTQHVLGKGAPITMDIPRTTRTEPDDDGGSIELDEEVLRAVEEKIHTSPGDTTA